MVGEKTTLALSETLIYVVSVYNTFLFTCSNNVIYIVALHKQVRNELTKNKITYTKTLKNTRYPNRSCTIHELLDAKLY